jgi:hypothetical protein
MVIRQLTFPIVWGGWRHGLAGGRASQGPIHLCHRGRCLVSALLVQRDDMLRWKARIQAFGRDLEAAGVMVCTCGAIGLSVFDLVKGLQELSGGLWTPSTTQGLSAAPLSRDRPWLGGCQQDLVAKKKPPPEAGAWWSDRSRDPTIKRCERP